MTQPSNLKVKRLVELDELPIENVGEAWTYAVQNNKDYKVDVAGLTDAIADEAAEEAADVVKDELAGPDGASLIGYGNTTVKDVLDTTFGTPSSLAIANDGNGHLWFRKADNTTVRGTMYVTGSGSTQTMNIRVYDDLGSYKMLSIRADGAFSWDGNTVYHSGNIPTWNQDTTGSAAKLTTPRNINGTAFDGSANITTANWGTARTLTIGSTGKSVNGSTNVTWSLSEIGAAPTSHTHDAGDVVSGKFDQARIPHLAGNEEAGWVRLSSIGNATDMMGSLRLTTGGNSFLYTFNGSTVLSCSSTGNLSTTGTISDSDGPVRRTKHRVANGSGNLNAGLDLNGIIEKTDTSAVTYTIPSGLGAAGDIITIINSGSSGNITVARASGVSLYRNGTNANITVQPGNMVSIVRTATNNRWQA